MLGLGVVWTPTDKTEPRPAAWVLPAWCYLNKLSGITRHHVLWELLPWGYPRLLDNVLSCRSSCWVLGFTMEVGNHPHSEGTFFKSTAAPSYLPRCGWQVSVTSLHLVLKDVAFKLIFPTVPIVSRSLSEFVNAGLLSLSLTMGWPVFSDAIKKNSFLKTGPYLLVLLAAILSEGLQTRKSYHVLAKFWILAKPNKY